MKLVQNEYNISIDFVENQFNVLQIENSVIFSHVVSGIWKQFNGEEQGFVLSEKEKNLNFSKETNVIMNPFSISCNDKKILTKVYQEIQNHILESFVDKYNEINQNMVTILDNVEEMIPYHVTYNLEAGMSELLKAYDIKIEQEDGDLIHRLSDFVSLVHKIIGTKLFVFVNLKGYLNVGELKQFYELCSYEKITILLIERTKIYSLDMEKTWIIDDDLCIINVFEDNNILPICELGEDLIL